MKIKIFISCFLFAGAFFLFSCGNKHSHGTSDHHHIEEHGEGTAYTSSFVCPMHCEGSGAEEAGTCPVCGMDYVALEEHAHDGHDHAE